MGMTGIMVFVRSGQERSVRNLETATVGLGVMDMGNKGAVGVRFDYFDGHAFASLTFVAAHLAAHEGNLQKRNENWKDIARRMVFSSKYKEAALRTARLVESAGETAPLLSDESPINATIYNPTSNLIVAGTFDALICALVSSPRRISAWLMRNYYSRFHLP